MIPLGDRVIVTRIEEPTISPGGILLPDNAREKSQQGIVHYVGEGRYENGVLIPMKVSLNDTVLFAKYGGTEFVYKGTEYIVLHERDLLAIL